MESRPVFGKKKTTDLGLTKHDQNKANKPFPTKWPLCLGCLVNSLPKFSENSPICFLKNDNLISIKFNNHYLGAFWFQLTHPSSPSTHTNSLQNDFLRSFLLYLVISRTIWVTHQMVYVNVHHFLNWILLLKTNMSTVFRSEWNMESIIFCV